MIVYLLLILALNSENEVRSASLFQIPPKEIQRLDDLKYYLCGLTKVFEDKYDHFWRGVGWFCVPKGNCTGTTKTYANKSNSGPDSDFIPDLPCSALRYNEGHDTCCYTSDLQPAILFDDPSFPDWDVYKYVKDESKTGDIAEMEEHRSALFREFLRGENSDIEVAMRDHEVCNIKPIGTHKSRYTVYTPYICVTVEQCTESEPHSSATFFGLMYSYGNRFCQRSTISNRPLCCHVSTVIPLDEQNPRTHDTWHFVEFLETQRYAPGFRAEFMCELYNKFVCDGEVDRCAQKKLHRNSYALPGEFPHHALVGISLPRRQSFHCQGAIISKLFVLSMYDCRVYDATLSNVVLVGGFRFEPDTERERAVNEHITYIKNHFSEFEKHYFLLLRLWRPLKLGPFIKPACINWYSPYPDEKLNTEYDFGTGWMLGYGPYTKKGNFSTNVTRYNFIFESTRSLNHDELEIECKARMPELKKLNFKGKYASSNNHLCLLGEYVYTPYLDKELNKSRENHLGYFSQGAPFSVFERYCQWKVYGIFIQHEDFLTKPPLLIETIPYALDWIENIVWGKDFDLIFFNLSWPECANWDTYEYKAPYSRRYGDPQYARFEFNFLKQDYNYLNPEYNMFYNL